MGQDSSPSPEQTVQCQNCLEFSDSSLTNCRYCGAVIDFDPLPVEEQVQSKFAQACRDGNLLMVMSRALAVCFIALTFSFLTTLALAGFLILLVAVPLMQVRWWMKYGRLPAENMAYQQARREAIVSAVVWCGVLLVWLFASVVQTLLFAQR